MKINYKGKEVSVSLALSPMGNETTMSIRLFTRSSNEDGMFVDETVGAKVISPGLATEKDLELIAKLKEVLQESSLSW